MNNNINSTLYMHASDTDEHSISDAGIQKNIWQKKLSLLTHICGWVNTIRQGVLLFCRSQYNLWWVDLAHTLALLGESPLYFGRCFSVKSEAHVSGCDVSHHALIFSLMGEDVLRYNNTPINMLCDLVD